MEFWIIVFLDFFPGVSSKDSTSSIDSNNFIGKTPN